jgi:hypothetical protein
VLLPLDEADAHPRPAVLVEGLGGAILLAFAPPCLGAHRAVVEVANEETVPISASVRAVRDDTVSHASLPRAVALVVDLAPALSFRRVDVERARGSAELLRRVRFVCGVRDLDQLLDDLVRILGLLLERRSSVGGPHRGREEHDSPDRR